MEKIAQSGLVPVAERWSCRFGTVSGWRVPLAYGSPESTAEVARRRVALADVSAAAKLLIQGREVHDVLAAQLGGWPERPTELYEFEDGWSTRVNRSEYYLVAPLARGDELVERLRRALAGRHAHITSLTHGRDAVAVIGPRAPELLGKLCGLDFHDRAFPDHSAQTGSLANVVALIARIDRADLPSYEVHVDRAVSEYVYESMLDAAEEFAGRPIGLDALSDAGLSSRTSSSVRGRECR